MYGITNTIYIYYKKPMIVSFIATCAFLFLVGLGNLYGMYVEISCGRSHSLLILLFIGLFWTIFGAIGCICQIKKLMHKGPVYIILSEGIMDCTFGFVPWSQVKKISVNTHGRLPTDAVIHISLLDPKAHFKSRLRSYFGMRQISLSPKIMRYEYGDNEPNQLT